MFNLESFDNIWCMYLLIICVASLQKGPHVAKIKIEIFVDLNRAGHDKSVEKHLAF